MQKGKDLTKLQRSPKFIEKDVSELEKNWEEVYQKATQKLTMLKVRKYYSVDLIFYKLRCYLSFEK